MPHPFLPVVVLQGAGRRELIRVGLMSAGAAADLTPVDLHGLAQRQPAQRARPDVLRGGCELGARWPRRVPPGSGTTPRSGRGTATRGRTSRHSSIASRRSSSSAPGRSPEPDGPEVQHGGVDVEPLGDLAHAVVEHRVARDPEPRAPGRPSAGRSRSTSPTMGRLSGGPWRHGVAVTSIGAGPSASSRGGLPGPRPRAPRRAAGHRQRGDDVPADGSRPARRRRGCRRGGRGVSSTASIGGRSPTATAGPASLRDADAPAEARTSARGVERRVGEQAPAADLDQHRRSADVGDRTSDCTAHPRVRPRPSRARRPRPPPSRPGGKQVRARDTRRPR